MYTLHPCCEKHHLTFYYFHTDFIKQALKGVLYAFRFLPFVQSHEIPATYTNGPSQQAATAKRILVHWQHKYTHFRQWWLNIQEMLLHKSDHGQMQIPIYIIYTIIFKFFGQ